MANKFLRFIKNKINPSIDVMKQLAKIKKTQNRVYYSFSKGNAHVDIFFYLKPTEQSVDYKIKLSVDLRKQKVKAFVVEPDIHKVHKNKNMPHVYSDGSLCLYYPSYNEFNYKDNWVETLIPWISLWLYYYELWEMTGTWLGGGIHPGQVPQSIKVPKE